MSAPRKSFQVYLDFSKRACSVEKQIHDLQEKLDKLNSNAETPKILEALRLHNIEFCKYKPEVDKLLQNPQIVANLEQHIQNTYLTPIQRILLDEQTNLTSKPKDERHDNQRAAINSLLEKFSNDVKPSEQLANLIGAFTPDITAKISNRGEKGWYLSKLWSQKEKVITSITKLLEEYKENIYPPHYPKKVMPQAHVKG